MGFTIASNSMKLTDVCWVQLPFLTSLFQLNNEFWNHDIIFWSGGGEAAAGQGGRNTGVKKGGKGEHGRG
jgi:hypothetical protein